MVRLKAVNAAWSYNRQLGTGLSHLIERVAAATIHVAEDHLFPSSL
jgi:hypothetical protein